MSALPNLLIIGAMKCGTSSLHTYLETHPEIQMSEPKELNFLTRQKAASRLGLDWYRSHFDGNFTVRGETSPGYTFYPYAQGAPERAAELVPHAKLIYLVRDPIARLVSHYVHRVSSGRERRTFESVVPTLAGELTDGEVDSLPGPPGYLVRSMYSLQLDQWRRHFPDSSILVVDNSELLRNREDALAEIAGFLGVDARFPPDGLTEIHNPSAGKRSPSALGRWGRRIGRASGARRLLPRSIRGALIRARPFNRSIDHPELSPGQRDHLAGLLRPDVERLRDYSGKEFSDWSV